MGESQGAEECFLCEEREEADQDQAKEEDHRGGEHCCFENPAIRLIIRPKDSGSEDGEGQEEEADNSRLPLILLMNKAIDRDGCYQEDSKRDEGVGRREVCGHKS